jgi:hypothetical protein
MDAAKKHHGIVRNGTIVLDEGAQIPEGTRVQVTPVNEAGEELTLIWLMKYAGCLKDMPSDFAAEHDHYIHGTPKRKREE